MERKNRRPISTDNQVAALKSEGATYLVRIKDNPGLFVRVTPKGFKAFVAVARDRHGDQVWHTIGGMELNIKENRREQDPDAPPRKTAIELGREILQRIKAGKPPVEPPEAKPQTVAEVAAEYFEGHVLNAQHVLRSRAEITRILKRYILPAWGKRPFEDIRRKNVALLLDPIEASSGPHQADQVLKLIRGLMFWYAGRNDDYNVPLTRGMGRVKKENRERDRFLDHDELRRVWAVAEDDDVFGGIVRILLLTGQRRDKVVSMKWSDIEDGVWTIATEPHEKGNADVLVLPPAALAIINQQHRIVGNEFVFAGRGGGHFKGFSARKLAFNARVGDIPRWTLHDLRRTARSLLSEAKVDRHISERVLGHALPGIEGVYDRHQYLEEKADALRRLADLIKAIVHPPTGTNVVSIRKAGAR